LSVFGVAVHRGCFVIGVADVVVGVMF